MIEHVVAEQFKLGHQSKGKNIQRSITIEKKFYNVLFGHWELQNGRWITSTPAETQLENKKDTLKVVTYNVLFDIPSDKHDFSDIVSCDKFSHLHSYIFTDIRYPFLCSLLEKTDADIIALEEVTPQLHNMLLTQDFVKKRYCIGVDWYLR